MLIALSKESSKREHKDFPESQSSKSAILIRVRCDYEVGGPYMIVCMYGSCAAGCNQEPVQAIGDRVVSRYGGSLMV